MVIKGYKNPIEDKDLYEVNEIDKAGLLVPRFEKHWRDETNKLLRYRQSFYYLYLVLNLHQYAHSPPPRIEF